MKKIGIERIEVKVGKEKISLSLDEARELHRVLSELLGKGDVNIVRLLPGFPKTLGEPIDISPPRHPNPPWPPPDSNSTGNPPPLITTIPACGTIPLTEGSLP